MKLISRRKDNASSPEGRDYLEPYEKDSVKDVVLLGSNEVVEVLAKFQPYPGVYVSQDLSKHDLGLILRRCSIAITLSILTRA
jgi:hypothetical protein